MRYEDIRVGDELPVTVVAPSSMDLVKFAAAVDDYYQAHYDRDFAETIGLPGVIVQGGLGLSYLGKMVQKWIGEEGSVEKLGGRYRGIMKVDEPVFCYGKVAAKRQEQEKAYIDLDIWAENPSGERTIDGKAVVKLEIRA